MKLWELEQELQAVKGFDKPKIQYEQYPTDAHLAANLVYMAHNTFDDIEGRSILDLGSGCGMLTIASILCGSGSNICCEIDLDAINIMKKNLEEMEIEDSQVDILQCDVETLPFEQKKIFDTALINPPFGTKKNEGIDMVFLKTALSLANNVYSMHKSSTREKCDDWQVKGQVLAEMKFKISNMYKFHKREVVYVEVDLWRIVA